MRAVALACGLALLLVTPVARATPAFVGLGALPGHTTSFATGISADGSVVVGLSGPGGGESAFRWTATGGMVDLGGLDDASGNRAAGASADGSVIAGESQSQAVRWTPGQGAVGLGFLPTNPDVCCYSTSSAVSGDGSVVTGFGSYDVGSFQQAFRWSEEEGMVGLGFLPGDVESYALGVSEDGSVVVGSSGFQDGPVVLQQPYRWTVEEGMVGLGNLPGADFGSAWGVSADGAVVVGQSGSFDDGLFEAFRWTEASGMVSLGALPGAPVSTAYSVSADGAVVVGESGEAFIWDPVHGMRSLRDVLMSSGLDLTGWTLIAAYSISADGRSIVGGGIDPSGHTQGWLAIVPEPSTGMLLAMGLAGLTIRRRSRAANR